MEKYNWFQNNMGSYIVVHNDGATETYIASVGNAEKAHFITTACNQLATDGREHLSARLTIKEKIIKALEMNLQEISDEKNKEITSLKSQIEYAEAEGKRLSEVATHWQKSCTEKEKECEELEYEERLSSQIIESQIKQIEELKAEKDQEIAEKNDELDRRECQINEILRTTGNAQDNLIKQIEELKAENERLKKILDIVNDRPDL